MANVSITPSVLSEMSTSNISRKGGYDKIINFDLTFTIDFASTNVVAGEYYLPLPESYLARKYLRNIQIQFEALGTNTALSFGLLNFEKLQTSKTNDKYVVDSAKVVDEKFITSFATTSAQDTWINKSKFSSSDYLFNDNDYLVIKNSGTADLTSGKIKIFLELYKFSQ